MNESLKGYRTQIAMIAGVILSTLDTIREFVTSLAGMLDVAMADGGAAASTVGLVVGIKALITDVVPKIKGNLDRTS